MTLCNRVTTQPPWRYRRLVVCLCEQVKHLRPDVKQFPILRQLLRYRIYFEMSADVSFDQCFAVSEFSTRIT